MRPPWLAPFLLCLCILAGAAAPAGAPRIVKIRSGKTVSLPDLVREVRSTRLVFVGESHGNLQHHQAQLAVIRGLRESGAQVAVALEMFRASAQPELDRWVAGRLSVDEFYRVYADNWNFSDWHEYFEIFRYARDHAVPMIGLNVSRDVVNRVARDGFGSLSESQRRELGMVECNVDPRYEELLADVLGQREKGAAYFRRFCEAQVVWDTAMAQRLIGYAQQNPKRTVVVLAGVFHAWRHGIPEQVTRRSPLSFRIVLPSDDEAVPRYDLLARDADYLWLHPPPRGQKAAG